MAEENSPDVNGFWETVLNRNISCNQDLLVSKWRFEIKRTLEIGHLSANDLNYRSQSLIAFIKFCENIAIGLH